MSANEWMRQSEVDVLDYLPKFLGKDPMFKMEFMNSIINLYSVGHIEEVNEEYYFKVYCIMNDEDTETLQKLIDQLDIYKPAHLGYAIYLGYSWNGKIHWNGEATFSTATIVSGKGVKASG